MMKCESAIVSGGVVGDGVNSMYGSLPFGAERGRVG